jgi:predicted RNase H-like HicB family nuclease
MFSACYNDSMSKVLTAIITEEDGGFVATNPDTGVVSQGDTLDSAVTNLTEAVSLYLEELGTTASSKLGFSQHSFLTTITV